MFLKHTLWAVLLIGCNAVAACAFTFTYGNYFTVNNIKHKNGIVILPLAHGKYKNVKVLSKELYQFLGKCEITCHLDVSNVQFASSDYRKAFTNENMMIADVTFNEEIIVTFLVFKNRKGFSVKTPEEVVFTDKKLETEVREYLQALAERVL